MDVDEYEHKASVTEVLVADHYTKGMDMNIRVTEVQKIQLQQRVIPSQTALAISLISIPGTEKVLVL